MNRESELLALYEEWRGLTQAEAAAIEGGNWEKLLDAQEQKRSLQARIDAATVEREREKAEPCAANPELKETLHELILLEQQNAAALAGRQQEFELERGQLDRSQGNLRQLQRAYSGNVVAVWQSYS
jgi:hypothetical protein